MEFASRTFSLPVQVLVEKGIIGFSLYSSFLVLIAREFILAMRPSPDQMLSRSTAVSNRDSGRPSGDLGSGTLAPQLVGKVIACCFAAGLIAVLFRELTYSSVLEHTVTLALIATLSALLVRPEHV